MGGLEDGSNRTLVAFLTDYRLCRGASFLSGLVSPTGLVACGALESPHGSHHGGVTTAGTARSRKRRVAEPQRSPASLWPPVRREAPGL